jgi:hypothetical protein
VRLCAENYKLHDSGKEKDHANLMHESVLTGVILCLSTSRSLLYNIEMFPLYELIKYLTIYVYYILIYMKNGRFHLSCTFRNDTKISTGPSVGTVHILFGDHYLDTFSKNHDRWI